MVAFFRRLSLVVPFAAALSSAPRLFGRLRGKREVSLPETVTVGKNLPIVDLEEVVEPPDGEKPESLVVSTAELFGTGKSILFGLPGAFTPTCSDVHLPGFVRYAPQLGRLGVETIACISDNDRFVLAAWNQTIAKCSGPNNAVKLLADADGELSTKLGLREDMGFGLGQRCKRFSILVEDGVVKYVATDDGMDICDATAAEKVIEFLGGKVQPAATNTGGVAGAIFALLAAGAAYYAYQNSQGQAPDLAALSLPAMVAICFPTL